MSAMSAVERSRRRNSGVASPARPFCHRPPGLIPAGGLLEMGSGSGAMAAGTPQTVADLKPVVTDTGSSHGAGGRAGRTSRPPGGHRGRGRPHRPAVRERSPWASNHCASRGCIWMISECWSSQIEPDQVRDLLMVGAPPQQVLGHHHRDHVVADHVLQERPVQPVAERIPTGLSSSVGRRPSWTARETIRPARPSSARSGRTGSPRSTPPEPPHLWPVRYGQRAGCSDGLPVDERHLDQVLGLAR